MESNRLPVVFAAAILVSLVNQGHAVTTVLSDNFNSNTQGSWIRRGAVTGSPAGGVDFSGGAAAITVASDNGQPQAIYQTFSSIVLANTGDYLQLTVDVRISDSASRDQDVRVGLGYAYDTLANSNLAGVPVDGYLATLPSNGNDTDSNIRFMNPASSTTVNFFNPGAATSTAVGSMGIDNNDIYSVTTDLKTLVWRVERNSLGGLDFSGSFNGLAFTSTVTATGTDIIDNYEFNTVGLSYAFRTGQTATYDNFTLVTNVPEPSSAAILGLVGTLLLVRRR